MLNKCRMKELVPLFLNVQRSVILTSPSIDFNSYRVVANGAHTDSLQLLSSCEPWLLTAHSTPRYRIPFCQRWDNLLRKPWSQPSHSNPLQILQPRCGWYRVIKLDLLASRWSNPMAPMLLQSSPLDEDEALPRFFFTLLVEIFMPFPQGKASTLKVFQKAREITRKIHAYIHINTYTCRISVPF